MRSSLCFCGSFGRVLTQTCVYGRGHFCDFEVSVVGGEGDYVGRRVGPDVDYFGDGAEHGTDAALRFGGDQSLDRGVFV